jgi:hypothetical protein
MFANIFIAIYPYTIISTVYVSNLLSYESNLRETSDHLYMGGVVSQICFHNCVLSLMISVSYISHYFSHL